MQTMRKDLNGSVYLAKTLTLLLLVFTAVAAMAAPPLASPFKTWTRLAPDPVVSPRGDGFESAGKFKPPVIKKDGGVVIIFRAPEPKGTLSLGYVPSRGGGHFARRHGPGKGF